MTDSLAQARKKHRITFWRPGLYWFGWWTLSPVIYSHNEFAQRTLLLGWTFTGRVNISLRDCGVQECRDIAILDLGEYP